jgi:aryl-alcohol dehydrogenase-like predicted oxidoreductase
MEKRAFGKTRLLVSILGFGGAEIGFQGANKQTVEKLLAEAIDAGLNVIDTAECYVNSEELIGSALSKRRGQVLIFTKCGHSKTYVDDAWSKKDIEASIDRSLKRLQTDYIDLVQLHSCSKVILEQGEVIEALSKAKRAGKTRFIGYSGDGQDAVYAIKTGAFDALQTSINIADQEAIQLTLPLAAEKNVGVIAKRPLANAAFKYKNKPDDAYSIPYWERLQQLKYDFIDGNADRAAAIALRFTLTIPGVHTAIVGTTKIGRYAQNAKILSTGLLSQNEFESIRSRWQDTAGPEWIGQR